jgi:iron complex outermembrane receptor protein
MKYSIKPFVIALLCGAAGTGVSAQTQPADLAGVAIEDLMRIEVTSSFRKEQRASETAAAIYVITKEEIRRSGISLVPELFRLAPGVQVAQINSNKWAISIRGFNQLLSNKVLVLIDGRAIYNRDFSGVFWESVDMPIVNIERIEIVRGPGGAIWGANAVNGVINIVTKQTRDSTGTAIELGTGSYNQGEAVARYGGSLGAASYRVYSKVTLHGPGRFEGGGTAPDDWQTTWNGMRIDWSHGRDTFSTEADLTAVRSTSMWRLLDGPTPGLPARVGAETDISTGSILGRWTHTTPAGSSFQAQAFVTVQQRQDDNGVDEREKVYDLDLQHHMKVGKHHDLMFGGGIRDVDGSVKGSFTFSVFPGTSDNEVFSAFAQDEIAFGRHLRVEVGAKVEHDSAGGFGIQPTARAILGVGRHRLWTSVSRVLRTPSEYDLGQRINVAVIPGPGLPIVIGSLGNPDYHVEELVQTEAGYRFEAGESVSIDVTAFHGHYSHLATNEPIAPVVETSPAPTHLFVATQYGNLLKSVTNGFEITGRWMPWPWWRLDGSYTTMRVTPHVDAASGDLLAASFDGNAPAHQWQAHSNLSFGDRSDLNTAIYYTGPLRRLGVEAYTRVDANLRYRMTKRLSVTGGVQNAFDRSHLEFVDQTSGLMSTAVPRAVTLGMRLKF